ncbi:MAG: tetratricopeptide repeat protein, partial [Verrucomicrobiaceae bacterium]|nr:tetratricopeptide repeat protein [Verrucomicrobiaceae bacterium]
MADTYLTLYLRLSETARAFLRVLVWFAPDPVPGALLDQWTDPAVAPFPPTLTGVLGELDAVHTLQWNPDHTAFTLPQALRHAAASDFIPQEETPASLPIALFWVNRAFTGDPGDVRTWPTNLAILPHAIAVAVSAADHDIPSPTTRLLNQAALLEKSRANFATAEPLFRLALALDEKNFTPAHPRLAIHLNNLATLLKDTNRLSEAEPLMRRALEIDETSFGPRHPNVATRLNNLAQLLKDTNQLAEAEPLMRRALEIDEASFGPQHPKVATRLNNLASLLQETNRLAEAEPLMQRALEIDEASFGPQHPNVAIRLNNLATLFKATNRLAEAE